MCGIQLSHPLPSGDWSSPAGGVAAGRGRHSVRLFLCELDGAWSSFGRLEVLPESDHSRDVPVSFDPVLNIVPGLESYTWAAQLRRFAYAGSRRARSAAPV